MCSRTTCGKCGRPTWSGCGRHVEQALAGVPPEARCRCREQATGAQGASPEQSGAPKRRRLFGLF